MNGRGGFVPYPPIEKHGVIGDRRTAALIAADGTIDGLCLPAYDSPPTLGRCWVPIEEDPCDSAR